MWRDSRITSHSIPALSRLRRHYHRLSRHYLARANVGAGFPHCPGVHGCIRPVTPSTPGLPHHISLNWEPSTLAALLHHSWPDHLTRNCNTISWLSHALLEPTVPAFGPACVWIGPLARLLACLLSKSEERGEIAPSWHTLPQLCPSPIFHKVSLPPLLLLLHDETV